MHHQIFKLGIGSTMSMPSLIISDEIGKWHDSGFKLEKEIEEYDWQYRKKICIHCPLEIQKKLNCIKGDIFVGGIQESYCKKMDNAREKKFRKKIEGFLESHPLRNGI